MSGVRKQVDFRVPTANEDKGVLLWNMDITGTIDDQHRHVRVQVEQRAQVERRPDPGQLHIIRFMFEPQRIADAAFHAIREGPIPGECRFDGTADDDRRVDVPRQARAGREVTAHRYAEMQDAPVAQRPCLDGQGAHQVSAVLRVHGAGTFTRARNVEGQHAHTGSQGDRLEEPVEIHFPGVHSTAGEQDGGIT